MQTILITGGTGMVGSKLTKHLAGKGYRVIILTRKTPASTHADPNITYSLWDVSQQTIDISAVQKADYIIHLAGAGVVDKKWSIAYKSTILKSRTESSALLIHTLQNNVHSVKAVVSASAIGWYGEDPSPGKDGFIESDDPADGFLGETCKLWEESIAPVEKLGIRLVKVRTGIVLSNEGGALPEFKKPIRLGLAAILGNGKQVLSWIHIDDLCRIFTEAIENQQLEGSFNAVAPNPVTNKVMTLALAKQLKGKFYIPVDVPKFVLKIMLGDRSTEVLKSTKVSCEKIKQTGFTFLYPSIEAALAQLAIT
ncbi:MAG: TIGR01777 family protein [Ferruginibacter sp.]|nr:TIGR01777 family protein [Ferruginibacter sp.]